MIDRAELGAERYRREAGLSPHRSVALVLDLDL
jgi:hypothetical protein